MRGLRALYLMSGDQIVGSLDVKQVQDIKHEREYADYYRSQKDMVERETARIGPRKELKARGFEQIANGSGLLSMAAAGQALGIGRNRFYDWCRARKYIKAYRREPFQRWVDAGLFVTKVEKLEQGTDADGNPRPQRIEQVPLVTPKGLAYFAERISGGIE